MGTTPRLVADSALAIIFAALTWGRSSWRTAAAVPGRTWRWSSSLAQTLPLAVRRVAPVLVWLMIAPATGIHGASEIADPPVFFGALVAAYAVAARGSRRSSLVGAAVSAVAILGAMLAAGDARLIDAVLNYVVFGTAWVPGDSVLGVRGPTPPSWRTGPPAWSALALLGLPPAVPPEVDAREAERGQPSAGAWSALPEDPLVMPSWLLISASRAWASLLIWCCSTSSIRASTDCPASSEVPRALA